MRTAIAYYLLLLYATVMMKPLIPIVTDVISHTLAEAIHIATVHAKYGSHHLEAEVEKNAKDENTNHQSSTSQEVEVHIQMNEIKFRFDNISTETFFSDLKINQPQPICILHTGPPPKFC